MVLPLVLLLQGGGRDLDDVKVVAEDRALCEAADLGKVPAPSTLGDWLRRTGCSRRAEEGGGVPGPRRGITDAKQHGVFVVPGDSRGQFSLTCIPVTSIRPPVASATSVLTLQEEAK